MYARKLDIGYFDHPPMIALMIRAGVLLSDSEAGLRLMTVLFSTLGIPVLWELTGKKNFLLFALLFLSVTVFQVYGFITVPDAPLLLFTSLFFLLYQRYLEKDTPMHTVLLSLVVALLLYSKYHGLLVVLFTVFSNLSLFRRRSFYGIMLLSVLFYLPHIYWQMSHDYPSYQYHVLNKSQSPYTPLDSLSFLGGVLLVAGPLTGLPMLYAAFRMRGQQPLLRAMRFTFFGFVLFFLFSTLNAAVEANWMAAAIVPLFVLGCRFFSEHEKLRLPVIRLSAVSAVLFLFARINLATDIVPMLGSKVAPEFFGWEDWAKSLEAHTHGARVVILNSYQRASKYSFHSKTEALSYNNAAYRRNQYDIWDIAPSMQGKRVALVTNSHPGSGFPVDSFLTMHGKTFVTRVDSFHSYTQVRIDTDKDWYRFPPGKEAGLTLKFRLPPGKVFFGKDSLYPVSLVCTRYYYQDYDTEVLLAGMTGRTIADGDTLHVRFRTPDKTGPYYIRFGFRNGWIMPELNSHLIRMDVEK